MSAYADTSFLVSLYTLDGHSAAAAAVMAQANLPLLLSSFGELELTNAIHLRAFRRELTRLQVKQTLAMIRRDIATGVYFLKPLSASVFERAMQLTRKHTRMLGTRTLDVLHVASALDLKVETFYSFDRQQIDLAKKVGLKVLP